MRSLVTFFVFVMLVGVAVTQASAQYYNSLTVKTDKSSYSSGEIIRVSGRVPAVVEGMPVGIQVFNPNNTVDKIGQPTPNADGTYVYEFDITGSLGISGTYTIKATYSGQSVQTTFQFAAGTKMITNIEIQAGSANAGDNKGYSPAEIEVPVGATVVWTNNDAAGHTVTSGKPGDADFGTLFDSSFPLIKPTATYEHTFDAAGEVYYFCQVHPWMVGEITVEGTMNQITINASTQSNNFKLGDMVTISGSVQPVTVGQPVVIQVFNPLGASFRFDEVNIGTSGSFTYSFKIDGQLAKIGDYKIDIGYFGAKKSLTIIVGEGTQVTTGKMSVSDTALVDATGSSVSKVTVDQQVVVQSKVSNNQDTTQEYAYILQIKDSDDIVVSLSWVQGQANAKQSLNVAQSWIPNVAGTYKAQIFVWQSITNPIPLTSSVTEIEINVSN